MKKFSVPEMHCGHCVAKIEKSIKAIDPTASVLCDVTRRSVSVASILNTNALVMAMREAGFEAEAA